MNALGLAPPTNGWTFLIPLHDWLQPHPRITRTAVTNDEVSVMADSTITLPLPNQHEARYPPTLELSSIKRALRRPRRKMHSSEGVRWLHELDIWCGIKLHDRMGLYNLTCSLFGCSSLPRTNTSNDLESGPDSLTTHVTAQANSAICR